MAVSKPKDASMYSFFRSPSMVFGTPMTEQGTPSARKYSDSRAAFVLESSPPMTTTASRPNALAVAALLANCSGVSILVRPEPMMSKPPVFLYSSMIDEYSSVTLLSTSPPGPPRKPISLESVFAAFRPSNKPAMTLWPPGAWPPDRMTPTVSFLRIPGAVPGMKRTTGLP